MIARSIAVLFVLLACAAASGCGKCEATSQVVQTISYLGPPDGGCFALCTMNGVYFAGEDGTPSAQDNDMGACLCLFSPLDQCR